MASRIYRQHEASYAAVTTTKYPVLDQRGHRRRNLRLWPERLNWD
ncbi:MAG: hypothetical protein AAF810_24010 [Cyanobacteria bacterium P01_D01_bin.36]